MRSFSRLAQRPKPGFVVAQPNVSLNVRITRVERSNASLPRWLAVGPE
jgi:hypothetical protein